MFSLTRFSFRRGWVVFCSRRDPAQMTGSVLFPQRALRGSTIGDNGSVAVEVIYYLRHADFGFLVFFQDEFRSRRWET